MAPGRMQTKILVLQALSSGRFYLYVNLKKNIYSTLTARVRMYDTSQQILTPTTGTVYIDSSTINSFIDLAIQYTRSGLDNLMGKLIWKVSAFCIHHVSAILSQTSPFIVNYFISVCIYYAFLSCFCLVYFRH